MMKRTNKTIGQILDDVSRRFPFREAVIHTEKASRRNYHQLMEESERIAGALNALGITKGDRVAIWAPNIPEWIISMVALMKIGALLVPIDPGADSHDLKYILEQSESKALITSPLVKDKAIIPIVTRMKKRISTLEKIIVITDGKVSPMLSWNELLAFENGNDENRIKEMGLSLRPEDPVAIMYTSGTTGKPKGVIVDHLGLITKSMFSTERQGITEQDRLCLFFPLFHMFGNTCIATAGLLRGASLVMPCYSFDPQKTLKTLHQEKCTAIYGSPSMFISLIDHPDFHVERWKTVKKGIIGGSPCPMELMKRIVEDIGVSQITVSYGITETSSWITMTRPNDPIERRVSTIGTALACNEVKIVDPNTGEDLPSHQIGELCTKDFLMKGYYKMPAATAAAMDQDGWFHTGDMGLVDEDGYFKITGRIKDVIIREGANIYPVEIEEVFYMLPEISEVQVFGFPHAEKGQEVAAWIRLKKGKSLSLDAVKDHAERFLNPKIIPHFYKFVSKFPVTRSGKVQKFRMAKMMSE